MQHVYISIEILYKCACACSSITTSDAVWDVIHHRSVTILEATVAHQSEDVVSDRFCDKRVVVQSPDIPKSLEDWLFIQHFGVKPTHVSITDTMPTTVHHIFWHR